MKNSGEVKVFAVIVVIAAGLVGGTLWFSSASNKRPALPPPPREIVKKLLSEPIHAYGKQDAPFTLVEFGDFQCPLCRTIAPDVKKLVDANRDRLRLVFHTVTVKPDHIHANYLGRVAYAAGAQGKFWEMSARLFDEQPVFAKYDALQVETKVLEIARSLGLDVARLQKFVDGSEGMKVQQRSLEILNESALRGTPSFFLIRPDERVLVFEELPHLKDVLSQKSTWDMNAVPGEQ